MTDVIVAGGGFRGITSAKLLADRGCNVTLVERAPFLGAVLWPFEWKEHGLFLDKGCHIFGSGDSTHDSIVLEILGDNFYPVDIKTASVLNGMVTDGTAVPDLCSLGEDVAARVLLEIIEQAAAVPEGPVAAQTLRDALRIQFGETAARCLEASVRKVAAAEPSDLASAALTTTIGNRMRAAGDAVSDLLKQIPALDDRIAGNNAADPYKYLGKVNPLVPTRHFYPRSGGTGGFCRDAQRCLTDLGVEVLLSMAIESFSADGKSVQVILGDTPRKFDYMVWALDTGLLSQIALGEDKASGFVHKTPMALYYFLTDAKAIGDKDFIQDYDANHQIFRVSRAGLYSNQQTADGKTYICAEVVTAMGSDLWEAPETFAGQVWDEARALGMVAGTKPDDVYVQKTPVSYKHPRVGFEDACAKVTEEVARRSDRVIVTDPMVLGYSAILKMLETVGVA
tara:strand:- start:22424 stop:23782 length:1359 start_codon:yes stop_codon:yes gene_type:complete